MNSEENKKKSSEEDFKAIREVLAGKESSFGFLQDKYKARITALIRRMIKDEDDVKDLVQESFIKAYKALPNFQFGYNFSAWIYRIASNNCIDFLRKKRFKTISIDQPINKEEDNYIDIEDNEMLPDISLISKERKQIINDAIAELPENYRTIINLRHKEELDYKEIAEELDLPLGTVKAHLFRARKTLLEALKDKRSIIRKLED